MNQPCRPHAAQKASVCTASGRTSQIAHGDAEAGAEFREFPDGGEALVGGFREHF